MQRIQQGVHRFFLRQPESPTRRFNVLSNNSEHQTCANVVPPSLATSESPVEKEPDAVGIDILPENVQHTSQTKDYIQETGTTVLPVVPQVDPSGSCTTAFSQGSEAVNSTAALVKGAAAPRDPHNSCELFAAIQVKGLDDNRVGDLLVHPSTETSTETPTSGAHDGISERSDAVLHRTSGSTPITCVDHINASNTDVVMHSRAASGPVAPTSMPGIHDHGPLQKNVQNTLRGIQGTAQRGLQQAQKHVLKIPRLLTRNAGTLSPRSEGSQLELYRGESRMGNDSNSTWKGPAPLLEDYIPEMPAARSSKGPKARTIDSRPLSVSRDVFSIWPDSSPPLPVQRGLSLVRPTKNNNVVPDGDLFDRACSPLTIHKSNSTPCMPVRARGKGHNAAPDERSRSFLLRQCSGDFGEGLTAKLDVNNVTNRIDPLVAYPLEDSSLPAPFKLERVTNDHGLPIKHAPFKCQPMSLVNSVPENQQLEESPKAHIPFPSSSRSHSMLSVSTQHTHNDEQHSSDSGPPISPTRAIEGDRRQSVGDDTIIAIIGPVGSGKSSFMGKATGTFDIGVGHGLCEGAHTRQIRTMTYETEKCGKIVLIDTPGIGDASVPELQIFLMISKWLKETYKRKVVLSAILCFHRITDNRIPWTPSKHLSVLQELCGNDAMSNIVLVTTMWDEVDEQVGRKRLAEVQGKYGEAMAAHGSMTLRYWNTEESARKLLGDVMDRKTKLPQVMQPQVSAVKEIQEDAVRLERYARLEKLARELLDISSRHRTGTVGKDGNDVHKDWDELDSAIDAVLRQLQALRHPPGKRAAALPFLTKRFGNRE